MVVVREKVDGDEAEEKKSGVSQQAVYCPNRQFPGLPTTSTLLLCLYHNMASQEWNPTQYFHPSKPPNPFALLILNQPINERAFADLHSHGIPHHIYVYVYVYAEVYTNETNSKIYRLRGRRRKQIF